MQRKSKMSNLKLIFCPSKKQKQPVLKLSVIGIVILLSNNFQSWEFYPVLYNIFSIAIKTVLSL